MRWILTALIVSGCYLSHRRAPRDEDAGRDASMPEHDAGRLECTDLAIRQLSLDDPDGLSNVTPRLAVLPRGEVAVVYVTPGAGDPTRLVYERIGPGLERITGPVEIATDGFTWAEPAVVDGRILVAYGLAGDASSVLREITLEGASTRTARVPLYHPSILRAAEPGTLFWLAFAMRAENALEIAHVGVDGSLAHPAVTIPLGRYGSGHGAVAHPTRRSHVLTYPAEGPPGVRAGHVNELAADGVLGVERELGDTASDALVPVVIDPLIVIVRHDDEQMMIERIDAETLERLDVVAFPPLSSRPLAAALRDRLLIAHVAASELEVLEFTDHALVGPRIHSATLPASLGASSGSIVSLGDAVVLALNLTSGSVTFPHLVRIECAR